MATNTCFTSSTVSTTGTRTGRLDGINVIEWLVQDLPIEEKQCVKGLVLCGHGHVAVDRQIAEKHLDLPCSIQKLFPRPHAVKPNVSPDPVAVGLLGPNCVVPDSHHLPHLVHEFELGVRNHQFHSLRCDGRIGGLPHHFCNLTPALHSYYSNVMERSKTSFFSASRIPCLCPNICLGGIFSGLINVGTNKYALSPVT